MTPQVRFSVEKVFDLPQRSGLLAVGTVVVGTVSKGMVLQSEESGARTTVLGIEMVAPPGGPSDQVTLILERTGPTPVVPGHVLTNAT